MVKRSAAVAAKPPTAAQTKFVESVLLGQTTAGHSSTGRSEKVREILAEARTELRTVSTITRLDVLDGIMEGITAAKQMSEPASIIKGWVEISKILGYDTPEVRKTALSESAAHLQNKLLNMTTAQLLEIAAGNLNPAVEGECTRVDH